MAFRDSPTKFEEAGAWIVVWSTVELCKSAEMDVVLSNEDAVIHIFQYWVLSIFEWALGSLAAVCILSCIGLSVVCPDVA